MGEHAASVLTLKDVLSYRNLVHAVAGAAVCIIVNASLPYRGSVFGIHSILLRMINDSVPLCVVAKTPDSQYGKPGSIHRTSNGQPSRNS